MVSGLSVLFLIVTVPSLASLGMTFTSMSPAFMASNNSTTVPVACCLATRFDGEAAVATRGKVTAGSAATTTAIHHVRENERTIGLPHLRIPGCALSSLYPAGRKRELTA